MSDNFITEIISPSNTILSEKTTEVIIPSFEGQMTILKDHISLITFLRPGFIEVTNKLSTNKFYVEDGIVEFSKNNLLILTASSKNIVDFTSDELINLIENAEKNVGKNELTDKEKYILSYKISTLKELNQ